MDSLKKFLLWLCTLFLICLIGISNVFADSYNNIGYLNNYSEVLVEVSYTGSPLPLTRTNTYQLEQVDALDINVSNYTFSDNFVYSIELFTPNTTLSNGNIYTVIGTTSTNQSVSCSVYDITYTDVHYPNFRFKCSSSINSLNIRIFNPSGSYIMPTGIFSWNYAYLRSINIDDSSQDIIDNQNQNTQDIINNQNQNTQDIIDNINMCTILDSSKTTFRGTLYDTGQFASSSTGSTYASDYIDISGYNLVVVSKATSGDNRACFYSSKTWSSTISCFVSSSINVGDTITIPNNAKYLRYISRPSENAPSYKLCKNGFSAISGGIDNLNDTLNDDDTSDAENEASEFFNSFTTNTFGLTSIITAPLNLIQSLTSKTCSPLHLPLPYLDNKYLDLPCMNTIYQQYFGSFFTLYQTITYGIIAYWVCVRIFNQVKDFKNPEHDEIEVMDL